MSIEPLDLDIDPQAYLHLLGILDEPIADVALTDREKSLRAISRDVVAREVAPRAAHLDTQHVFAHESVQALAQANLVGVLFPTTFGGTNDGNVAYAVVMEEIAAGCAATSLVFMTQMHAAYPIMIAGSDDLAQRYIPRLLDGSLYGSLAITEPDAGSDVASIRTIATPTTDGGSYELSGAKTFITTGDRADLIVCFATVDRARGRSGITAFVVDGHAKGVGHSQPFDKLGMNGSSTAELFFDQVDVPSDHRLGDEGCGWNIVMQSVAKTRISAAAQGVGIARAAYVRTLATLHRIHGSRLPEDKMFTLAEMRGQILQGRLLLHSTARALDQNAGVSTAQIGIMKQACTDLGFRTAVAATRVLGPWGDLAILGVERCLRDAKILQIYDGTNEIQRLLVGREIAYALKELP